MAGSATLTEEIHGTVKKIKIAWTSGTGGDAGKADKTTEEVYSGALIMVATVPDGTSTPSANYDVELNDADGIDLLAGNGQNRSDTDTEFITSGMGAVANDKLTLAVTNAGDTKKGTIYIYIR